MFSFFKNLFHTDKLVEVNSEVKVADEVNTQLTINKDTQQNTLININVGTLVGYNYNEDILLGLENANKNSKLLGEEVKKLLNSNNISLEDVKGKIQNPEFLLAITEVAKASYIESNEEKRQTLANLVYKKITSNENFESIILSQAIKVIGTLSEEQLKCLALIFLLRSQYIINNIKVEELNDFFEKYIMPLININEELLSIVGMGIYSSGCAITFTWGSSAADFFPKIEYDNPTNYPADDLLRSKINNYETLREMWQISAIQAAHLTPVGKCIAHSYLYAKTGIIIDWKNDK